MDQELKIFTLGIIIFGIIVMGGLTVYNFSQPLIQYRIEVIDCNGQILDSQIVKARFRPPIRQYWTGSFQYCYGMKAYGCQRILVTPEGD